MQQTKVNRVCVCGKCKDQGGKNMGAFVVIGIILAAFLIAACYVAGYPVFG